MSDKKYFSRHAKAYLGLQGEELLQKDFVDAISQEPSNVKKIKEQYEKAKEAITKIKKEKDFQFNYERAVDIGLDNIRHATLTRTIRKNTFSRWLGLLPMSLYMTSGMLAIGATGMIVSPTDEVKEVQVMKNIEWAMWASALTILAMMAMLYVVFRKEEKRDALYNTPNITPLFDGLVKYVYGNIGKENLLISDTLFYAFGGGDKDLDGFIAGMKDYQTMHSRVIDLEAKLPAELSGSDFYNRVFSVCAIVIGVMSDKDIVKLVSLLEKDKSIDKANAMLTNFIASDVNLRGLVTSVLNGNTDTSLLSPIRAMDKRGARAITHTWRDEIYAKTDR